MKGWERIHEFRRGTISGQRIFMAMKFGNNSADNAFRTIFKKAAEEVGFSLEKLDDQPQLGLIDERLRDNIRRSRMLFADLTHQNPGAYWESGFAEGIGKPVLYLCRNDQWKKFKTHFDTNHHLTVIWNPKKPDVGKEQIKSILRNTFPDEVINED
jgi:hypothetical protein